MPIVCLHIFVCDRCVRKLASAPLQVHGVVAVFSKGIENFSVMKSSQAKDALEHPYFDDLDKAAINALESDVIRARELEE